MNNYGKRLSLSNVISHAVLIGTAAIIGTPMYCAIVVSTQTIGETLSNPLQLGTGLVSNFEYAFSHNLGRFMLNSTAIAMTTALSKTVLSLMAGLAFSFFRFWGKWILFGAILFTLMLPEDVLMIALFRFMSGTLGLGNTFAGVILPALASAFGTFLFRQHFSLIPAELSEAAQLDGMNPIQYLIFVLVPLSWNAIGALFVVVFIGSWNMYLWPLVMITTPDNQVVQVGLRTISTAGDSSDRYGPVMIGAVLASIPPLLVFLLLQRQFIQGFAIGRD